jgi:hypothetical protein
MRTGRLWEIELRLENGMKEGSRLMDNLIEKYGDPETTELFGEVMRVTTWRNATANNVIQLLEIPMTYCYILSYRPFNYLLD